MTQNCFEDNMQNIRPNVMTKDPYCNIEAALAYLGKSSDKLTPEAKRHIGQYIHFQCQRWAEELDERWGCEEVVYGLIRANIIVQQDDKSGEYKTVPLRQAVEQRARMPLVRYGVEKGDKQASDRIFVLTDMLFDDDNKPVYEKQGLFLANLVSGIMIDNRNVNQNTCDVAKVILDSIFRLPDNARENACCLFSSAGWPEDVKQYYEQKQEDSKKEQNMPILIASNTTLRNGNQNKLTR